MLLRGSETQSIIKFNVIWFSSSFSFFFLECLHYCCAYYYYYYFESFALDIVVLSSNNIFYSILKNHFVNSKVWDWNRSVKGGKEGQKVRLLWEFVLIY